MSYDLASFAASQSSIEDLTNGDADLLQGRYRLLKPIGQGGFGKTFLVVDESQPLRSYCVIKQLLPCNPERQAAMLHQEGLRLAELGKHPQIPTLLGMFEQNGQGYLVQEFIDGQTLEQELAESGALKASQIRDLLKQLLPVLQFIHDRQVIHRDIKPANIIRRPDGQLVLVDFGAAKAYSDNLPMHTGTLIGTAEYAAPEQTRGRAVFASDLYSLGVSCVHLMTQMPPFDLFDDGEDLWNWQDFLPSSIDSSLTHILNRLLCSRINLRYHSAAEVLEDLESLPISGSLLETENSEVVQVERLAAGESISLLNLFSKGFRSSFSATVFVPSAQKWYSISPASETSNLANQLENRLSPHLAAARFPVHELSYNNLDKRSSNRDTEKHSDLVWWILNILMLSTVTAAAVTVTVLALEPYLSVISSNAKKLNSTQNLEQSVPSFSKKAKPFQGIK